MSTTDLSGRIGALGLAWAAVGACSEGAGCDAVLRPALTGSIRDAASGVGIARILRISAQRRRPTPSAPTPVAVEVAGGADTASAYSVVDRLNGTYLVAFAADGYTTLVQELALDNASCDGATERLDLRLRRAGR